MTSERGREFSFAAAHDAPIPISSGSATITRRSAMARPTSGRTTPMCRSSPWPSRSPRAGVTIVTTAAPYQPGQGRSGSGRALQCGGQVLHRLFGRHGAGSRPAHLARRHRPQAHDGRGSRQLFPLRPCAAGPSGRIGLVAPRFHGAPDQSQPSHDARGRLSGDRRSLQGRQRRCRDPCRNCPVCHQTVSLAARALEENGISTVVMGCAKDIVEYVGVPRFLFSDFPLGNAAGRPKDRARKPHTRSRAAPSRTPPRRAHHRAVSDVLERKPDWKLDYRIGRAVARGDRPAPRRIRQAEGVAKGLREELGITKSTAKATVA